MTVLNNSQSTYCFAGNSLSFFDIKLSLVAVEVRVLRRMWRILWAEKKINAEALRAAYISLEAIRKKI